MVFRIIVGVKYCFRYNQRNRRAQQDENGEPIDMTTMQRPHRRRREKKLMSMDEVNERFPLVKYKAWMNTRAEEGLPTAGGVAPPSTSRPASLRNADGAIEMSRKSTEGQRPQTPATEHRHSEDTKYSPMSTKAPEIQQGTGEPNATSKQQEKNTEMREADPKANQAPNLTRATTAEEHAEDEMDEDDQIQIAVPSEMLANPGDSCAICLDTLEDDDDVRGLSCGHTFHASCLDPWLTSRKACCPLCKADYFVPKPRTEADIAADAERQARGRVADGRTGMPRPPQYAFMGHRNGRRMLLPGRLMTQFHQDERARDRYGFPIRGQRLERPARRRSTHPVAIFNESSGDPTTPPNGNTQRIRAWPFRIGNPFRRNNNTNNNNNITEPSAPAPGGGGPEIMTGNQPHQQQATTPSQLEAGQQQQR